MFSRIVASLLLAVLVTSNQALGADAPGGVIVHVRDISGAPLPYSDIALIGGQTTRAVTDDHGDIHFSSLPLGSITVRAWKAGYEEREAPVTIVSNEDAELNVYLTRQGSTLKQISSVTVRYHSHVSQSDFSNDERRAIGFDPLNALQFAPQVSLNPTGGIGINGHPTTQTDFSIGGVSVAPPGAHLGTAFLGSDIFSALSVGGATGGALGGSIRVDSPDPTLLWQSQLTGNTSSDGRNGFAFWERGTTGFVGLSIGHAVNSITNPLDNQTFLDSSGLSYSHNGSSTVTGNSFKIRAPFRSQIFSFQDTNIVTNNGLVCNIKAGLLPCGYGPGAQDSDALNSLQISDQLSIGKVPVWLSSFRNSGSSNSQGDASLIYNPIWLGTTRWTSAGGAVTLQAFATAKSQMTASYSLFHWSENQSNGSSSPSIGSYASESSYARFDHRLSAATTTGVTVFQSVINGSGAVEVSTDARTSTKVGDFSAAYDGGRMGAPSQGYDYIDSPNRLTFYCGQHIAIGNGPWMQAPRTTVSAVDAAWHRKTRRIESTIFASNHTEFNALTPIYVPGSTLGGTLFNQSYVDQANALLGTVPLCGTTAPLTQQNFYYQVQANAPRVRYQTVRGTARFLLGDFAFVQPYFQIQSANQYGLAARLQTPSLYPYDGTQFVGVAPQKYGLFADVNLRHAEAIVNWSYSGNNNEYGPRSFSVVGAAVALHLKNGSQVTISGDNLLNAKPGSFAGATTGLVSINGTQVPTLNWPLPRRQVSVRFDLRARRELAQSSADDANLRVTTDALPNIPPAEPFGLNRASEDCTPENAARAQRDLANLTVYTTYAESERAANRIPQDRTVDGITYTYRLTPTSFSIGVSSKDVHVVFPMFRCAYLHVGSLDAIRAAGAYVPTPQEMQAAKVVWYTPPFGLYVVNQEVPEHSTSVKIAALPDTAPLRPLLLTADTTTCPSYLRSAASSLLSSLGSQIDAWRANKNFDPASPWQIVPHGTYQNGWLQLALPSDQMGDAIVACATIHGASATALKAKGFDGAPLPALNFSARLGLYVLADPTK